MSFFTWLSSVFGGNTVPLNGVDLREYAEEYAAAVEFHVRELAFWSCIEIVSNAVAKCEFKTYQNGKESKLKEYYLWNIEPNQNQNSSVFLKKLISMLYLRNEALVIEQNGKLYVADSYDKKEYALYEDLFSNVTIGDFTYNRSFRQGEVLYMQRSLRNMKPVIDALYGSYGKLISYGMSTYQKSRGTKGIFKYEALPQPNTPEKQYFDTLINEKISKWLNTDAAALPLGKGQDWKELTQKTYSNETTRDIRAMIDDICEFTARGFGIPPTLLTGAVQDTSKAIDQLLTFSVDPLLDMISEEINRKRNGYAGFANGNYLKIDSKSIKHIDLLSVSTAIDKLISSGAFCINDIRKLVGEEPIDEKWAWEHYITKNYEPLTNQTLLNPPEGGE